MTFNMIYKQQSLFVIKISGIKFLSLVNCPIVCWYNIQLKNLMKVKNGKIIIRKKKI
jgi:hypothetical protein